MPTNNFTIHIAVTSHGLGHLTRCVAVLRSLRKMLPNSSFHVSTAINANWIQNSLGFDVNWRKQDYEPGALQKNCFEVDVPGTLLAYRTFADEYQQRLKQERDFLRTCRIDAVVSDISAIAVRAASDLGIPAVGLSNFTWDWILEPWCQGEDRKIVSRLAEDYATGLRHLCLPFGPDRSSFPAFEKAALIARHAKKTPEEVRRELDLPSGPIALVSPGGWDPDGWPKIHARTGGLQLVTVGDLPITTDSPCRRLPHTLPGGLTFPDLVAAAEVVLGKPGYGIASECLIHKVPFAMLERPDFRETPALIAEMQRRGRCSVTSIEQFFSGDWEAILNRTISGGENWDAIELNGADLVAKRIADLFGIQPG